MKKGMCKGCENLTKRLQIQYYEKDGTTRITPPKEVLKPFCCEYNLHLEYVDRVIEDECTHYI